MTVRSSDPPAAGTQQAIDANQVQAQAERDRAVIAALSDRVRQLEKHAAEGTTTAQNYGGSSVA